MGKIHRRVKVTLKLDCNHILEFWQPTDKVSCWGHITDLFVSTEGTWLAESRLSSLWIIWDPHRLMSYPQPPTELPTEDKHWPAEPRTHIWSCRIIWWRTNQLTGHHSLFKHWQTLKSLKWTRTLFYSKRIRTLSSIENTLTPWWPTRK